MKINVERMRYKNDSISFMLCMFGLIFNVVQFIQIHANCYLQTMTGKEGFNYYDIGVDILYNILFMLIVFYMAEELKTYHKNWSYVALIIGILQLLRINWFPKTMFDNGFYDAAVLRWVEFFYILSAACFFIAAAVSFTKSTMLAAFLKTGRVQGK